MSSLSPPKPWEQSTTARPAGSLPTSTASPVSNTAPTAPPSLPDRPFGLAPSAPLTGVNPYNSMAVNRFGSSPYGLGGTYGGYGSYSGYGSYGSPYSRFGSNYGSMYGGGYGGMYGGGMAGMGAGMYGGMGMPADPNGMSLTQSLGQSTQATFQLIESLVGAFGGFAQMLESTYMATHSSFFAMVSVAEQFGNLRRTLGQVLGIFTLIRWIRNGIARLTGRPPPASSKDLTQAKFAAFNGQLPDGTPAPQLSKKPLIIFALAIFGLPYLMGKFINAMSKSQEEEQRRQLELAGHVADPSKLDFCRVLYDYPADPATAATVSDADLVVKKNDLVAILSKTDPAGNPSQWWRCRARDGRMGYLPSPYLESIQRKQVVAPAPPSSVADVVVPLRAGDVPSKPGPPSERADSVTSSTTLASPQLKAKD